MSEQPNVTFHYVYTAKHTKRTCQVGISTADWVVSRALWDGRRQRTKMVSFLTAWICVDGFRTLGIYMAGICAFVSIFSFLCLYGHLSHYNTYEPEDRSQQSHQVNTGKLSSNHIQVHRTASTRIIITRPEEAWKPVSNHIPYLLDSSPSPFTAVLYI